MSQLIKHALGQIKCEIVGHEASQEDEDLLYIKPSRQLRTKCNRCGANVLLEVDGTDEDAYFITEVMEYGHSGR